MSQQPNNDVNLVDQLTAALEEVKKANPLFHERAIEKSKRAVSDIIWGFEHGNEKVREAAMIQALYVFYVLSPVFDELILKADD